MTLSKIGLLIALLVPTTAAAGQETPPPIEKLDWLIGEWDFVDNEVAGDYEETGTRNCEYALDGDYILCVSCGTNQRGTERTYLFYLNYNRLDERFEMTSLFGGFPRKVLHELEVSEDGHRLEMKYGGWEAGGLQFDTHAIILYNGADRYTWESHAPHDGPETGEHAVRFRDVVTRRER